jgi:acetoacetate decarboxylase
MGGSAASTSSAATRTRAYVVQGKTVSLPVIVRDATSMSAMFVVPTAAVRRLLPSVPVHVPEVFPGRTLCVIAAIEYRDNDLGQYNEMSVAFFVTTGGRPPTPLFGMLSGFRRGTIGAYIHRLPVTTSFSRDAGRDIWGFPKTVDDIQFHTDGARAACTLAVDGKHVLTLSMPRGGRRHMKEMPQDAYAWHNGVLWKTPSVMGGDGVGLRLGGVGLALGDHPIADELRGLGLPKRALMGTWVEHMHARFDAPVALTS